MNTKQLINKLKQAPKDMDIEIFGIGGDQLTSLDICHIPDEQDIKEGNNTIQLTTKNVENYYD